MIGPGSAGTLTRIKMFTENEWRRLTHTLYLLAADQVFRNFIQPQGIDQFKKGLPLEDFRIKMAAHHLFLRMRNFSIKKINNKKNTSHTWQGICALAIQMVGLLPLTVNI